MSRECNFQYYTSDQKRCKTCSVVRDIDDTDDACPRTYEAERSKLADVLSYTEPTFTLRASDPVAPVLVRRWARKTLTRHIEADTATPEIIAEVNRAKALAAEMDKWQNGL